MATPIKLFQAGDVAGYCTVIRLLQDAKTFEQRIYEVYASCCGRKMHRSQRSLRDNQRRERGCCDECAREGRRGSVGLSGGRQTVSLTAPPPWRQEYLLPPGVVSAASAWPRPGRRL